LLGLRAAWRWLLQDRCQVCVHPVSGDGTRRPVTREHGSYSLVLSPSPLVARLRIRSQVLIFQSFEALLFLASQLLSLCLESPRLTLLRRLWLHLLALSRVSGLVGDGAGLEAGVSVRGGLGLASCILGDLILHLLELFEV
jgi:hypothetical protein